MPKKGNYNQDYYKIAGKEPGGSDILPEKARQEYGIERKNIGKGKSSRAKSPKSRKPANKGS